MEDRERQHYIRSEFVVGVLLKRADNYNRCNHYPPYDGGHRSTASTVTISYQHCYNNLLTYPDQFKLRLLVKMKLV